MHYYLLARIVFDDDFLDTEWAEMKRLEQEINRQFKVIARSVSPKGDKIDLCVACFGGNPQILKKLLDDLIFFCESHSNHRVLEYFCEIESIDSIGMGE
jgi:hypothetical protein